MERCGGVGGKRDCSAVRRAEQSRAKKKRKRSHVAPVKMGEEQRAHTKLNSYGIVKSSHVYVEED